MKKVCIKIGLVIGAVLLMHSVARADAFKTKFVATVYSDAQAVALKNPEGVALHGDTLYVADTGNRRVVRYAYKDKTISAEAVYSLGEVYPIAIRVNSKGALFVVDGKSQRIVRLTADGTVTGPLEPQGVAGGKMAVRSLAIDSNDNLFVLDLLGDRVVVLDAGGRFLRQVAFPEPHGFFSDLLVDRKGDLFLLDSVRGEVIVSQKGTAAFAPFSTGVKEYMSFPVSMSSDGRGDLFLVDQHGSGIVMVGPDGTFQGRQLSMGWDEGHVFFPTQACMNDKGDLIVADRSNSRVQIFTFEVK